MVGDDDQGRVGERGRRPVFVPPYIDIDEVEHAPEDALARGNDAAPPQVVERGEPVTAGEALDRADEPARQGGLTRIGVGQFGKRSWLRHVPATSRTA